MAKLLFVVHRYAPYPGGSEYYVQNMAEECLKRGHDVHVLTGQHKATDGKWNGVYMLDNPQLLGDKWDLIVVHGGDVQMQDIVHQNAAVINSPIVYMIIKPSHSPSCVHGMKYADYLAYSTKADLTHISTYGQQQKARRIRHGVKVEDTISQIPERRNEIVSCGGFWPHKGMKELAAAWEKNKMPYPLVLYGYGDHANAPTETENVKVIYGAEKSEVMDAISSSNGVIMNSFEEGFGLVLIEAMFNKTPWLARSSVEGAKQLSLYGHLYIDEDDLCNGIYHGVQETDQHLNEAFDYAWQNHRIECTVDDIEDILFEATKKRG